MKKLYFFILFIAVWCVNAQAQSVQIIQPTDSLEQRRQKENSNFSLFNSRYNGLNANAHSHANKTLLDLLPTALGSTNRFLAVSSDGTTFEWKSLVAGSGISISHSGGVTTISASGAGITSLNGLIGTTQTFVNDTNVTIASSGTAHTITWSGLLPASRGGTNNAFFQVSGPATSAKTFTFPNANATVLTDNAAVTVAQGGTGSNTFTGLLIGNGTSPVTATATSSGVAGAVGDEVGSGPLVFGNGPTLDSAIATTYLRYSAGAESRYYPASGSFYVGFKAPSSLSANKIWDLPQADGTASQVLTTDGSGHLSWSTQLGSGVGEANTASNVGVGGVGLFKQKLSADLQFRNVNAGSSKLSVTLDAGNNEVDLDVVEANLNHANIGGTTPVSKGGTGATSLTGILVGNGTSAVSTVTAPTGAIVGTTDSQTLDHKVIDAEATGNAITLSSKVWMDAASCEGSTASSNWDAFSSNVPVAACAAGSNTVKGVLDFADGASDLSVQRTIALPADWTGQVDVKFVWFGSATTGNVVWGVATGCAGDGALDDPTFNNYNEVTDGAKGTANQLNDAAITNITTSGCSAGKLLHIKIARRLSQSADTMASTARLIGIEATLRRAQ
jgi:hypothetical protein